MWNIRKTISFMMFEKKVAEEILRAQSFAITYQTITNQVISEPNMPVR
jgi:hypothetical protein